MDDFGLEPQLHHQTEFYLQLRQYWMAKYLFSPFVKMLLCMSGHLEMCFEGLSRYKASFPDF
jgi:hypothetical protein